MLRFARLLVFFRSVLFHLLWLRLLVSSLPRVSTCCGSGCPFLFLSRLFGLVCFFLFSGLLRFSASCASGCSSLVPLHRLSSMLWVLLWLCLSCPGAVYPAFLLVFFRLGFLRLLCVSSLSLGLRSLSWCLFLLVFVWFLRSGFSSFSTGSALLCCCGLCLSAFLTRSNLRFPSRRGLPLGQVRLTSASVFLGFYFPAYLGILFCLSPLRSSALFASGVIFVSCSPGELSFSLVIYLVRGWFSWAFSCSSSFVTLPPFFWLFLAVFPLFQSSVSSSCSCSVPLLLSSYPLSVRGSLSPFLGRSS